MRCLSRHLCAEDQSEAVLLDISNSIAVVTLNRPNNRNSMTPDLLQAFRKAIADINGIEDQDVRCVVITGRGSSFCAGADFRAGKPFSSKSAWEETLDDMYGPFLKTLDIKA